MLLQMSTTYRDDVNFRQLLTDYQRLMVVSCRRRVSCCWLLAATDWLTCWLIARIRESTSLRNAAQFDSRAQLEQIFNHRQSHTTQCCCFCCCCRPQAEPIMRSPADEAELVACN